MKQVTIDRATWATTFIKNGIRHSTFRGAPMLLDDKGHRCCLGFAVGQLCNIPDATLLDCYHPGRVSQLQDELFVRPGPICEELRSSNFSRLAMHLNDLTGSGYNLSDNIDPPTKERLLTEHFAAHGVALTFVGEYPAHILEVFPRAEVST